MILRGKLAFCPTLKFKKFLFQGSEDLKNQTNFIDKAIFLGNIPFHFLKRGYPFPKESV
jgi:hypothetical protein